MALRVPRSTVARRVLAGSSPNGDAVEGSARTEREAELNAASARCRRRPRGVHAAAADWALHLRGLRGSAGRRGCAVQPSLKHLEPAYRARPAQRPEAYAVDGLLRCDVDASQDLRIHADSASELALLAEPENGFHQLEIEERRVAAPRQRSGSRSHAPSRWAMTFAVEL